MFTESQREVLRSYGILLARVALGGLFFLSGVQIIMSGRAGVEGVAGMVGSVGVPFAMFAAVLVVAIKVLGGAALMLGYRTGLAAATLFFFTAIATLAFHLGEAPVAIFGWDMGLFKNLAIMSALLYAMAYGPGEGWRLSLDKESDTVTIG